MKSDRYYKKGNPEKELSDVVASQKGSVTTEGDTLMSAQVSRYTKPEASQMPRAFFVIYSGGTQREKDYFHLIDRNPNVFPSIKIDFIAESNFDEGGKPTIMQVAIDKTKEYKDSANEENPDIYFLLTDVDHFENFLLEMKHDCDANDIELIISNSCFEVWLYYAEKADRCIGFEIPSNKLEISSRFKTWANTQVKGGLKTTKAIFKIEQNIKNAKCNYTESNGIPTLFSTQMFRLAEKMLPYVKDGLEILKK